LVEERDAVGGIPAEKMEVTIRALVKSGKTPMPMFFIAITYGLEAPVPAPSPSPNNMLYNVGSSYGRMIPTHSAPMMKKSPNRKYIVLNAVLMVLRG
jgi:hypothetical protein